MTSSQYTALACCRSLNPLTCLARYHGESEFNHPPPLPVRPGRRLLLLLLLFSPRRAPPPSPQPGLNRWWTLASLDREPDKQIVVGLHRLLVILCLCAIMLYIFAMMHLPRRPENDERLRTLCMGALTALMLATLITMFGF